MDTTIILAFLSNVVLMMSMAVVYSLFPTNTTFSPVIKKIIMGVLVSIIGITVMSYRYELELGIIFDARAVVMSISGMFLGVVPTVIGMITLSIYRAVIGGIGVYTGIMWILASGSLGLLWRHYRLKNPLLKFEKITWLELYLVGLVIQITMVLLLFSLPSDVRIKTIKSVYLPILIVYPIGSLFVSSFMLIQRKRYFQNEHMKRSEEQYRNLFDKSKTVLLLLDPTNGTIIDANNKALEVYGYTKEEFKNMPITTLSFKSKKNILFELNQTLDEKETYFQAKHKTKSGKHIDVEIHSGPVKIEDKNLLLSTIIDVTKQLRTERDFRDIDERLRATLQRVVEGVIVIDKYGRIELMNHSAKEILGFESTPHKRKVFKIIRMYSEENRDFYTLYNMVIQDNKAVQSEGDYVLLHPKTDDPINISFSLSPINSKKEKNHGAIFVFRDITEQKKQEKEIRYISQHDFLTGLYNRYHFEAQLKRINTKRQLPITLIIGDLNGLKLLNDTYGHFEGDRLIKEAATIFKQAVRSEDIVARWGGDEFVILLPQTTNKDAKKVYTRIKDLCNRSKYDIIKPSIAVGYATKIKEEQDIYQTLQIAEEYMYNEKVDLNDEMRRSLLHSLEQTIVKQSYEKQEHAEKMLTLAKEFAQFLKLNPEQTKQLIDVIRFHDIGKISIDKSILQKNETLTEEEKSQLFAHPKIGSRILESIPEYKDIAFYVLSCHENWDGTGYPNKLKEKAIPYISRITAIIETYDVMIQGRLYRKRISKGTAIKILQEESNRKYDPELIKSFIAYVK